MERTLYLNENTTLNVIRDGPSLVVKEEGSLAGVCLQGWFNGL